MITSEAMFAEQTQRAILHGLHWTASIVELLGVVVIICGVVVATAWSFGELRHGEFVAAFGSYRAINTI